MRLFIVIFVIVFLGSIYAENVCGVCGLKSGVMCLDDSTFAFCNPDKTTSPGRYRCPDGMKCGDSEKICAIDMTGIATCAPTCGKCSANKRFACTSRNTFTLCYGADYPSGLLFKCPDNSICSTTMDTTSTQFCFNPISIKDEHISCFGDAVASVVKNPPNVINVATSVKL